MESRPLLSITSFRLPSPLWAAAFSIRQAVFVEEQACPPEEEWDTYDAKAMHLLARRGTTAIGTARWRVVATPNGPAAKLERFAVLVPFRGQGIGEALVAATLRDAESAGHTRFLMHAQAHLAAFYRRFGFHRVGDVFEEVGIPHVAMAKEQ